MTTGKKIVCGAFWGLWSSNFTRTLIASLNFGTIILFAMLICSILSLLYNCLILSTEVARKEIKLTVLPHKRKNINGAARISL